VDSFREKILTSVQLEVDGTHQVKPCEDVDAFSKYFESVGPYINPCQWAFLSLFLLFLYLCTCSGTEFSLISAVFSKIMEASGNCSCSEESQ
jgi:hypothetical protein